MAVPGLVPALCLQGRFLLRHGLEDVSAQDLSHSHGHLARRRPRGDIGSDPVHKGQRLLTQFLRVETKPRRHPVEIGDLHHSGIRDSMPETNPVLRPNMTEEQLGHLEFRATSNLT
ncbi:hypothetical protein GCM10009555_024380 [Acrocarpospora macrocephala]|uniref:Uncharacterized protein n=1 Tax=Acrocarpospora macrocephala TaxID=150177 RepID=A0A5M3WWP8_9ACTN|nr:hypothetical protein Amac_059660 [Acrocarpospora macrocephala]